MEHSGAVTILKPLFKTESSTFSYFLLLLGTSKFTCAFIFSKFSGRNHPTVVYYQNKVPIIVQ